MMTEKEQADCLIELHKEQSLKHQQLINLEFKINIALWSLIVLAGYFILKDILPGRAKIDAMLFSIGYLLISLMLLYFHYNFWIFPITRSQVVSDFYVKSYLCKIEELAQFKISSNTSILRPKIKNFSDFPPNYKNWIIVETGITGLLLGLIFLFGLFEKL